jgi:hypothetical protein
MKKTEAAKNLAHTLAALVAHPRAEKKRHERLTQDIEKALVAFRDADDGDNADAAQEQPQ